MVIHEVEQGSLEWMALRAGIPTASELDALLTPLWKIKTGDGPQTYLEKKLAEWWQGGPLPGFSGAFATEQGTILEQEARPWFSLEYKVDIKRVGFITTDDGLFGCSPDGLLDKEGLEIKCPEAHTHVGYLLDGVLPKDYMAQVHGGMYVTGFESWKFVSYRRNFPQLVLTVERDDKIQGHIAEALDLFQERFEEGKAKLIEINGGPPRHLRSVAPKTPKPPAEPYVSQMPS
jgi:hypothetical protein